MEKLRCVVERITYHNELNGYSVIRCRAKGFGELVTVVGLMPEVHVGSVLVLGGSWKIDPRYGRQFTAETFEETLPATVYGIEKYLGSGLIKGVGPEFARRIVKEFGRDTLEVIETDPDRLMSVPGIGKARVEQIRNSWQEQREVKNIMLFLQEHDVSTSHATKIYKTYGNESIGIVRENPYRLADDVWGIGFRTADLIAEKMGFGHERYARLRSGLLYTLNRLADDGHCYATRAMLLEKGTELLEVEDNVLSMTLDEMIRSRDVIVQPPLSDAGQSLMPADFMQSGTAQLETIRPETKQSGTAQVETIRPETKQSGTPRSDRMPADAMRADLAQGVFSPADSKPDNAIYLPPFFFAEKGSARRLAAIFRNRQGIRVDAEGLENRVAARTGMHYDEVQMKAILMAVQSKILVLTGGPGTGKTTTTLGIIAAFREAGARILLAAPTGRAARRLAETTGMEAKTIHRLLEMKPPEGYRKNEEEPLQGDVLIVDECSMIDLLLFYNLLKAVPDTMTIILVGDIDQLPSVGAGNVLRDIIDADCFPVVRLTRIFRQARTSRIITNAHRINEGHMPDISNGKNSDFFFTDMDRMAEKLSAQQGRTVEPAEAALRTILDLVKNRLPRYYRIPPAEIQVLTPMQRGIIGASNLNQELQKALNPAQSAGPGLRRGGFIFRSRDKVMQIRNNYDKEVFNGDIGVVQAVDAQERNLTVQFDDRCVVYDVSELDELVLAYAVTIHKSQGSEYPVVVMPVLMNHYIMLQRNLIYTGITRAKKALVAAGTRKALAYAVRNVTVQRRNTMLSARLSLELSKE